MDPLRDEKIVLTLLRVCPEFMMSALHIHAEREAYGPSKNEGLCYESCSQIGFAGDVNGSIYLAMDGYTKMKLLPRIAEKFQIDPSIQGMATSVLLEFSNQMTSGVVNDLRDGGLNVNLLPPESLNNKLVPLDLTKNREYILIFFLRDRRLRRYLGRLYVILTLQKY